MEAPRRRGVPPRRSARGLGTLRRSRLATARGFSPHQHHATLAADRYCCSLIRGVGSFFRQRGEPARDSASMDRP
jgi:hypothetical protein